MTKRHRFKVDKLIRDQMPDILRAQGITVFERVMETDEYLKRLKDKLLKETHEFIAANTVEDKTEELADILEVLHCLIATEGFTFEQVEAARLAKKQTKGGFEKRIYNAYIEMASNAESIGYYRARPESYPEVEEA